MYTLNRHSFIHINHLRLWLDITALQSTASANSKNHVLLGFGKI